MAANTYAEPCFTGEITLDRTFDTDMFNRLAKELDLPFETDSLGNISTDADWKRIDDMPTQLSRMITEVIPRCLPENGPWKIEGTLTEVDEDDEPENLNAYTLETVEHMNQIRITHLVSRITWEPTNISRVARAN